MNDRLKNLPTQDQFQALVKFIGKPEGDLDEVVAILSDYVQKQSPEYALEFESFIEQEYGNYWHDMTEEDHEVGMLLPKSICDLMEERALQTEGQDKVEDGPDHAEFLAELDKLEGEFQVHARKQGDKVMVVFDMPDLSRSGFVVTRKEAEDILDEWKEGGPDQYWVTSECGGRTHLNFGAAFWSLTPEQADYLYDEMREALK